MTFCVFALLAIAPESAEGNTDKISSISSIYRESCESGLTYSLAFDGQVDHTRSTGMKRVTCDESEMLLHCMILNGFLCSRRCKVLCRDTRHAKDNKVSYYSQTVKIETFQERSKTKLSVAVARSANLSTTRGYLSQNAGEPRI